MKLWLISQDFNNGYDKFDSAVVVAASAVDAQRIHPDGRENTEEQGMFPSWAAPQHVRAEYIGETDREAGEVICASFNAG